MEKTRRQFTPQQKLAILREHIVKRVPVSDLCDKPKLHRLSFTSGRKPSLRTESQPLKVGGPLRPFVAIQLTARKAPGGEGQN